MAPRLALILFLMAGCGEDLLAQADSAALMVSSHSGSGVYAGHGRVMTNWHVCVAPMFDESIALDDHLRFYNDAAPPVREGLAPTSFYCPRGDAADVDFVVSERDEGGCVPVVSLGGQRARFTRAGVEAFPGTLLFADWTLDACIFEVGDEARAALDRRVAPLVLARDPVTIGQRVIVAGHQRDAINQVGVEECGVTGLPRAVVDPDPINPSPLEVPSFTIDCAQVEHGSSGSPVFDAGDGRLLGLVWTGTDLGGAAPTVYVSAISAWRAHLATRPAAQWSQLGAVLESQSD